MKEISKEELKGLQLEILNSIHDCCEQFGIRYSLSSGTLLGAVRHKGFIPWDDDIDIMMPRPDYNRFCELYPGFNDHYEIQNYHNDDAYWFNFGKVFDNRTLFIEGAARNGVYVDIFIVDGLPGDMPTVEQIKSQATSLLNRDLRWATKEYKVRTAPKEKILHFLKYQYRKHLVDGRQKTAAKLDDLLMNHSFDSSPMAAYFFFDFFEGYLPRSVYEEYKDIEFEGRNYKTIADTHQYLENVYGDYMKLPPEEERVARHNIHAYWL